MPSTRTRSRTPRSRRDREGSSPPPNARTETMKAIRSFGTCGSPGVGVLRTAAYAGFRAVGVASRSCSGPLTASVGHRGGTSRRAQRSSGSGGFCGRLHGRMRAGLQAGFCLGNEKRASIHPADEKQLAALAAELAPRRARPTTRRDTPRGPSPSSRFTQLSSGKPACPTSSEGMSGVAFFRRCARIQRTPATAIPPGDQDLKDERAAEVRDRSGDESSGSRAPPDRTCR